MDDEKTLRIEVVSDSGNPQKPSISPSPSQPPEKPAPSTPKAPPSPQAPQQPGSSQPAPQQPRSTSTPPGTPAQPAAPAAPTAPAPTVGIPNAPPLPAAPAGPPAPPANPAPIVPSIPISSIGRAAGVAGATSGIAGAALIAVGGTIAAFGAVTTAAGILSYSFNRLASNLSKYDTGIAGAEALNEIKTTFARINQANQLSNELSQFTNKKTESELILIRIETQLTKLTSAALGTFQDATNEVLKILASGLEHTNTARENAAKQLELIEKGLDPNNGITYFLRAYLQFFREDFLQKSEADLKAENSVLEALKPHRFDDEIFHVENQIGSHAPRPGSPRRRYFDESP